MEMGLQRGLEARNVAEGAVPPTVDQGCLRGSSLLRFPVRHALHVMGRTLRLGNGRG